MARKSEACSFSRMGTDARETAEAAANARHQFERLVFFSDAVFAIAITLLVLDLHLPANAHGAFAFDALLTSKLVAFALSFFVIGIYWLNHHRLFGGLAREDGALRVVNLVFLACVAFLPFPTSVIAELHPSPASVSLYAASVAAVGIMLVMLVLVARRPVLMRPDQTMSETRRLLARSIATPLIFLASIPIAQANPRAATESWWLIALVHPLIARIGRPPR